MMETGSKQLVMEEGGVELTLSPVSKISNQKHQKSKKASSSSSSSSSFIQKIRNSPKLSVRKNGQIDKQRFTASVATSSSNKNHHQDVSSRLEDRAAASSLGILIGDETYTFKESTSSCTKDDWGISWSSSTITATSSAQSPGGIDKINSTSSPNGKKQHQFQKKDFHKSTWLGALKRGSYSTYGVAALMTASSIIVHPLLILAGVVWAVGAFRALDKEYNLFNDKTFSQLFWSDNSNQDDEIKCSENENSSNNDQTQIQNEDAQTNNNDKTNIHESEDTNTNYDDILPLKSLINHHFPPLEATVLSNVSFTGLNAVEFFDVFFSDEAPFSMKDFQSSRGDIDLDYERWTNISEERLSSSMHPSAKLISQLPPLVASSRQRKIHFKTLTKSYFGPAYASAHKKTIVTKVSQDYIVLESETRLSDIPFSDRFFVIERWYIDSTNDGKARNDSSSNSDDDPFCKINISVGIEVVMVKECTFERQIRQKTIEGVTEILKSWTEIAKEALEITAQSKLSKHHQDPGEAENSLFVPWNCFSDKQIEETSFVDHPQNEARSRKEILSKHQRRFEEMESLLQLNQSIELELAECSRKTVKVVFHDEKNLTVHSAQQ